MPIDTEIPLSVLVRTFRVPTVDIPVDYPGREMLLGSAITNVSVTGVFVRTGKPKDRGAHLDVTFQLPDSKHMIQATTLVRWSVPPERAEKGEAAGMGLEFTRISKRDAKAVERFVRQFLERMRRQR